MSEPLNAEEVAALFADHCLACGARRCCGTPNYGTTVCLERTERDLETKIQEHEQSFNLRWQADIRAIKAWHAAGGDELTWPDHANLCVWLMGELTKERRRAQKAEGALLRAEAKVRSWDSPERQREAGERDRAMDAIGKAEGRERG